MSAVRDQLGSPRGESVAGPFSADAARDAAAAEGDAPAAEAGAAGPGSSHAQVQLAGMAGRRSSAQHRLSTAALSVRAKLRLGGQRFSRSPPGPSPPLQPAALARAPLLDFAKLQVLTAKLLGMGSTARVYEGRWCGRPCAVKVRLVGCRRCARMLSSRQDTPTPKKIISSCKYALFPPVFFCIYGYNF